MSLPSRAGNDPHSGPFTAILWIGLVAGTLDITDNLIFNYFRGISATRVFQYIAAGLIGPRSARMGMESVALGVAIHFAIALTWTAIFYLAARKIEVLTRRPVICGLLYGGAVYLIMNFAVLPLTRVPRARAAMTLSSRINGVLALLICMGLTVALLTRWDLERNGLSRNPWI
jgi:hypothetical protein